MDLSGVYAPIATPFKQDAIDREGLASNLDRWSRTPLAGVVVPGSNGESVLLDEDEKIELVSWVRSCYQRELKVIAGTGCESTRATIRLTGRCAEAGADAALVLTPTFYKSELSTEALYQYFVEVAECSPIPVILYNMPRNSGINMPAPLTIRLSHHPNIIGIKDSGGNIAQIGEVLAGAGRNFQVLAGSGSFLLPALMLGAVGGIMAVAGVAPDICVDIVNCCREGDMERARSLQLRILALNAAVTTRWGIAGLKAALDAIGYVGGNPRRPLLPFDPDNRPALRKLLQEVGVI